MKIYTRALSYSKRKGTAWLYVNLSKSGRLFINIYQGSGRLNTIKIPRTAMFTLCNQLRKVRPDRNYPDKLGKWHVPPAELYKMLNKPEVKNVKKRRKDI